MARAEAWDRLRRYAAAGFSIFIFALALWVLNRSLGRFDVDEVLAAARAYPGGSLALALVFCLASYAVLSGFDWLGTLYVGRSLPTFWVMLISFVSHSISHNAGFAILTGGSVRLRMYGIFGLGMGEVAAIIAFAGLSFALGAAAVASLAFILDAPMVAPLMRLPVPLLQVLGWGIFGLILLYLLWASRSRRPLAIGSWRLSSPSLPLGIGQILVAAADLALVAAALYVLLPLEQTGIGYIAFIGVYVVATLAGTLSHVPGGLGVFEGMLVLLLPELPPQQVLAAMLLFRLFYNLLPLLLGASVLAVFESVHRRQGRPPPAWVQALGPSVAGMLAFAAGTVLLVTGAVAPPTALPRLLAEPAHLLSGAAGGLLLILAWGMVRRSRQAHDIALGVLVAGAMLALARGPDWAAAAVLGLTLALLSAAGPLFDRDGRVPAPPWAWAGAASAVVAGAIWLTWHGEQGTIAMLAFDTADEGARAMRSNLIAVVSLAAVGLAGWKTRSEPAPR